MTAATRRLRRALSLLGQAIEELHASLPLTRERQQLLDVVTAREREEATR